MVEWSIASLMYISNSWFVFSFSALQVIYVSQLYKALLEYGLVKLLPCRSSSYAISAPAP